MALVRSSAGLLLRFALTLAALVLLGADAHPLWAEATTHERIDALLEAGLVGAPVPAATDNEFLRRIYLDLTGRIPTAREAREFVADAGADKRVRVVDRLLASPQFVRHLSNSLDIMLMERRQEKYVPNAEWRQYLFDSVAANKPLNEIYREILEADGAEPARRPAAKFLLEREVEPNLLTRDVGRMVFGVDMQCAQCHDHPLINDYEQREYYGLFAFFQRSSLFLDTKDNNKAYVAETCEGDASFKSVFTQEEGQTKPCLPGASELEDVLLAKDDLYAVKPDKEVRPVPNYSRRKRLADEIVRGDNRAFQRNLANRLWAHMMGRGLVDPVDLQHDDNPPSHPELLDLLADELTTMRFDMRAFLRELALTRAYQRSVYVPVDWRREVASAVAQQGALEAELAARAAELAAAQQAASGQQNLVQQQYDTLAAERTAFREKEVAAVEADKVAHDTTRAVAATQTRMETLRPIAQALADALVAGRRAAELLPEEPALTDALTKLQAQSDKPTAELTAVEAALAAEQPAAANATAALATAQQNLQAARANWEQVSQPLRNAQSQYDGAKEQLRHAKNRWMLAKRRSDDTRKLADVQPALEAAVSARDKLAQLEARQSSLDQQITMLESMSIDGIDPQAADQRMQQLVVMKDELLQLMLQMDTARQEVTLTLAAEKEAAEAIEQIWIRQAAAAPLKPLSPEQLCWSMLLATGLLERQQLASEAELKQKPDAPSDPRQLEIALEKDVFTKLEGNVGEFVRLFGGGAGQPQHVFYATVDQALFFSNGGYLPSWVAPGAGNLTERLSNLPDAAAIADELYMSVLTRAPTSDEVALIRQALESQPQEKAAIVQEFTWALLTSAEFRFSP